MNFLGSSSSYKSKLKLLSAAMQIEKLKFWTRKLKVAKASKEEIVIAHEMKYIVRRAYFIKRFDSNMEAEIKVEDSFWRFNFEK